MNRVRPWSYRGRKAASRRTARRRLMERVRRPIQRPVRDPLQRNPRSPYRALVWVLAGVGLHTVVGGVFFLGSALGARQAPERPRAEPLQVEVVQLPPEPEPVPEPPAAEPEPEPEAKPEPRAPRSRRAPPKRPPPRRPSTPSRDPVNEPKAAPEPDPPAPRRVVGLNLESTVSGGEGPGFATGNTRMGETSRQAEAPKPRDDLPAGEAPQAGQNASATRIPGFAGAGGGGTLVKPKRLSGSECPYPKDLENRNLEGTVTIRATVGPDGRVKDVKVVDGASVKRFNEAAVACARRARYEPARRDGKKVRYTITYPYRFRLEN